VLQRSSVAIPLDFAFDRPRRGSTVPPPAPSGIKVLVVDDDAAARELVMRYLEKDGHRVLLAGDGDEGLRLAREMRPDLITLDVMMPRMNGWTMLEKLREDPALAAIPVVLLTVVDHEDQALASGAKELLTKPIDRERLAAVVNKYTQRGRAAAGG
jgi:CheY-like chemotaxis protein